MCIAVEDMHGVDVRDSMKLKLFGSTLWMDSILGSMGVVMLVALCGGTRYYNRMVDWCCMPRMVRGSVYVCMGGKAEACHSAPLPGGSPLPLS